MKQHSLIAAILTITMHSHAQNVGIGTNDPATKLHVNGDILVEGPSFMHGYVAIGIGAPQAQLSVIAPSAASTIATFKRQGGGLANIRVYNFLSSGTAELGTSDNGPYAGTPDITPFHIQTSGLIRLTVSDEGNIGIGLTQATNKLDVNGAMVIGGGYAGNHTASSNGLLVEGNTGLGEINPAVQLQVSGAIASTSAGIDVTSGPQTVNPGNKSYLRINNTGVAPAVITLGNGLADGQILYVLTNSGGGGGIQFIDNALNNTQLSSNYLMTTDDTLTLIWNASLSKWIELHRSIN